MSIHEDISQTTHAIFAKFFMHVAYGCGSVLLRRADEIPLGAVFFPIDNTLYSIAFRTHTKTAELIEMPFGMMSGLGPRNSVLHYAWGGDPRRGKHVPQKLNTLNNCELVVSTNSGGSM